MKQKVIVIGAGIIGLLTAYFLQKKGFEVEVLEAKNGVGLGASFANGSQISFSHIFPTYFNIRKGFFSCFKKQEKFESFIKEDQNIERFIHLQEKEKHHLDENLKKSAQIANVSLESLNELIKDEAIESYIKNCGIIHFFDSQEAAEIEFQNSKLYGQQARLVSRKEMIKYEPNIASFDTNIESGVYYPNDKTSNCHDLCKVIEGILLSRGANFYFNTQVQNFKTQNNAVVSAKVANGQEFKADYFVVCCGTASQSIASNLAIDLPIFPVRGYSCTFNVEKSNYAPTVGLIDRRRKMVYSHYKTYLKVAGFFDLGVNNQYLIDQRMKDFQSIIFSAFPMLKRNRIIHKWTENRPFTPNCIPIIGKTEKIENVFINTGHGALGFTLSFGSGKIISELI